MCFLKAKVKSIGKSSVEIKNGQLVIPKQNIHDYYLFQENEQSEQILGIGGFSFVVKAINKKTGEIFAIKIIQKDLLKNQLEIVSNQEQILLQLKHKNIIQFFEKFQSDSRIYLILGYCEGGQLFNYVEKRGKFEQKEAKQIMVQITQAVQYCHSKKFVHRDLKLNNLLFQNNSKNPLIKLIDFGCSVKLENGQKLKNPVGTVFYMAPQVINQSYDASCDIWSLGIILYILLTGYPPYYGQTQQEILDMIKQSNYTFQVDQNEKLSVQALDLLSKCLTTPEKRITATQILKHKWFTEILKDENLNE